ncbi:MAG TPA: hypothetical protein VK866_12495, partial [Acidimicrobiales bacterium]|nr:hypothetical protein [Acidimicrobiales bacterium]
LPLARPGVVAGGLLVFLTCMKELPATLLLAPTGFDTVSTQVWNATSEAFFARAAAPALALVLLSALPMALLVVRESEGPLLGTGRRRRAQRAAEASTGTDPAAPVEVAPAS